METQTESLVRKQFFISNKQIEKIERLCKEGGKGVSAAQIVRKAIDEYDPDGKRAKTKQMDLLELAQTKVKEAIEATEKANKTVTAGLKKLSKGDR